jgi:hypothetical protein
VGNYKLRSLDIRCHRLDRPACSPITRFLSSLVGAAIIVGVAATVLLIWFQWDLGQLRIRAEKANTIIFLKEERDALGLEPYKHPYIWGCNVLVPLIVVCLSGAGLVVAAVVLGPAPDQAAG